jgi:hypothetical protein
MHWNPPSWFWIPMAMDRSNTTNSSIGTKGKCSPPRHPVEDVCSRSVLNNLSISIAESYSSIPSSHRLQNSIQKSRLQDRLASIYISMDSEFDPHPHPHPTPSSSRNDRLDSRRQRISS